MTAEQRAIAWGLVAGLAIFGAGVAAGQGALLPALAAVGTLALAGWRGTVALRAGAEDEIDAVIDKTASHFDLVEYLRASDPKADDRLARLDRAAERRP